MGFFKDFFNDIKTANTPIGHFKDKVTDYFNYVSLLTHGKENISEEIHTERSCGNA